MNPSLPNDSSRTFFENLMMGSSRIFTEPVSNSCQICGNSTRQKFPLPCSHTICILCASFRATNPIVCRECSYSFPPNENEVGFPDTGVVVRLPPTPLATDSERSRTSSESSLHTLASPSPYASNSSSPIFELGGGGGGGASALDIPDHTTGAIPKGRRRQFDEGNRILNSFTNGEYYETQFYFSNSNANEPCQVPPLSPIVGGETRVPRTPSQFLRQESPFATSPLPAASFQLVGSKQGQQAEDDFPCCYHGKYCINYYCKFCEIAFCYECLPLHQNHRYTKYQDARTAILMTLQELAIKSQNRRKDIKNSCLEIQQIKCDLGKSVELAKQKACLAIQNAVEKLEERKRELLQSLETIHFQKESALDDQAKMLNSVESNLEAMECRIIDGINYSSKTQLLRLQKDFRENLQDIDSVSSHLNPHDDSFVDFTSVPEKVYESIGNLGTYKLKAAPSNSFAFGTCAKKTVINTESEFVVQCQDRIKRLCKSGGEKIQAKITYPSGANCDLCVKDMENGQYTVYYFAHEFGSYTIDITCRGIPISNSPLKPVVHSGRNLRYVNNNQTLFGMGDSPENSLERGWGIHADIDGFIYATDRNKHCVYIFNSELQLHSKFGKYGYADGELNRPTGITIDKYRRILIVDKDNHRVQIFTIYGEFILKFGKCGNAKGDFNYPWDIDSNSEGQIVVSDTKNRRVQIFNSQGGFIKMLEAKGSYGLFDVPRGVCYDHRGNILMSDFNSNVIVVIDKTLTLEKATTLGRPGSGNGLFYRPQGLHVDRSGNIIVAESMNHRIQIFSPDGKFMNKIIHQRNAAPESFAPCDITVSHDGIIYAADANARHFYRF